MVIIEHSNNQMNTINWLNKNGWPVQFVRNKYQSINQFQAQHSRNLRPFPRDRQISGSNRSVSRATPMQLAGRFVASISGGDLERTGSERTSPSVATSFNRSWRHDGQRSSSPHFLSGSRRQQHPPRNWKIADARSPSVFYVSGLRLFLGLTRSPRVLTKFCKMLARTKHAIVRRHDMPPCRGQLDGGVSMVQPPANASEAIFVPTVNIDRKRI